MPILQSVPSSRFREQPWANGAGTTTELAAGPDPARWRWRISLARIDSEGPFSPLPGVHRQLAPLDGGLVLDFADGRTRTARRLEVVHFDGDPPPSCRLPDGPGRDLNLMLRAGAEGELLARPLLDSMLLLARPHTRWFVYTLAGEAMLKAGDDASLVVAQDQAAWVQPSPGQRVIIEGGGEIALVRLVDSPV